MRDGSVAEPFVGGDARGRTIPIRVHHHAGRSRRGARPRPLHARRFEPRITFAVGDGWTAEQATSGFFDIQDVPGSLDVVAVQFANVVGDAAADDVIGEIQANPQLSVSDPESVDIGGLEGTRIVVETIDPPETEPPLFRPVLVTAAGPLSIASGRRLQVNLFDTPNGVLAILVGGSIAEWDRALQASEPVLESVAIGG